MNRTPRALRLARRPTPLEAGRLVAAGLVMAGLAAPRLATADTGPVDLRHVLSHRAAVVPADEAGTAQRLELPPEVLGESRSDLADLRLVDSQGRSIPFAVAPPPAQEESEVSVSSPPLELVAVDRQRDEEDRPLRERLVFSVRNVGLAFDALEVTFPPGPPFVARTRLERQHEGEPPVVLVDGAALFRLPSEGRGAPGAARARIPLPADRTGPADELVLDVTIQEGRWLAPSEVVLTRRETRETRQARHRLDVLGVDSDGEHTVVRIDRPAGVRVHRLVIETSTEALLRRVHLRDELGRPIGDGVLARLPGADAAPLELDVRLPPSPGRVLELVVDDGGEAPLRDLAVSGDLALPALVFTPPPGSVLGPGAGDLALGLYWGGGRLTRQPERSLDTFREAAHPVTTRGRWVDGLPAARLGPLGPNPVYRVEPAVGFAHRPGAEVDPRGWRSRRTLTVPETPEGLGAWTLDADDLAALRPDRGDLRIVDDADRQAAYVEAPGSTLRLEAEVRRGEAERAGESALEIVLPASPLPVTAVELRAAESFVDRRVRVTGRREGDDRIRELTTGRFVRRDGRGPLSISLPAGGRVEALRVEIVDGDDPPLDVTAATLEVPTSRILLAAPPGTYTALEGNPEVSAPRYELERARDLVVTLPTAAVEAAPLDENPAHRRRGLVERVDGRAVVLWATIAGTGLLLVLMTLKLARSEGSPPA